VAAPRPGVAPFAELARLVAKTSRAHLVVPPGGDDRHSAPGRRRGPAGAVGAVRHGVADAVVSLCRMGSGALPCPASRRRTTSSPG
jgi:hypothetical protein